MTDAGCRPGPSPRLGACPHLAPSAPQPPGGGRWARVLGAACSAGRARCARPALGMPVSCSAWSSPHCWLAAACVSTRWHPPTPGGWGAVGQHSGGSILGRPARPGTVRRRQRAPPRGRAPPIGGVGTGEAQQLSPVLRRAAQAAPAPSLWRPAGLRRGRPTQRRSLAMQGLF